MGSVPSAKIGTRLIGTAILIVQSRFYYEWPEIARALPPDFFKVIEEKQARRAAVSGENPDHFRSFNF